MQRGASGGRGRRVDFVPARREPVPDHVPAAASPAAAADPAAREGTAPDGPAAARTGARPEPMPPAERDLPPGRPSADSAILPAAPTAGAMHTSDQPTPGRSAAAPRADETPGGAATPPAVTVDVLVEADGPPEAALAVRDALLTLPAVLHAHADAEEAGPRLSVLTQDPAALLGQIRSAPALAGAAVRYRSDGRLLIVVSGPRGAEAAAPKPRPDAPTEVQSGLLAVGASVDAPMAGAAPEPAAGPAPHEPPETPGTPAGQDGSSGASAAASHGPLPSRRRLNVPDLAGTGRGRPIVIGAAVVAVLTVVLALGLMRRSSDTTTPDGGRRAGVPATAAISGAAGPAGATATATAGPPATATPAATPAGTTPRTVARSFDPGCRVPPERTPCDAEARARWDGNLGAWQAEAVRAGEPLPDTEGAIARSLRMRMDALDPPTRIETARAAGQPALFLAEARLLPDAAGRGTDVEVELANLGAGPADLAGARVLDQHGDPLLVLPAGATLAAGERCRISTGAPPADACPFRPDAARRLPSDGTIALVLVNQDGTRIDVLDF